MKFIADRAHNPFGMEPPCERFVPGYGSTDADFHVVGDHPGAHGGLATGIPFTDMPWSERFLSALVSGNLLQAVDGDSVDSVQTYFSYLHMCEPDSQPPAESSYANLEPYFDAELRAITAHVLLPVGRRATEHVFRAYTAIEADRAAEMADLHARELHGSGWLIVPIKHPETWTDEDEHTLVDRLRSLLASDYRQISDLGRFKPDGDTHFVR